MGSRSLVICDPEEEYAKALAAYLANKKELALQVQVCSDLQEIQELQVKNGIDHLLISSDYDPEQREKIKAARKFVLTGDGHEIIGDGETAVYKYQSGEAILSELIQHLDAHDSLGGMFFKSIQKEGGKIIGVFSPVHRSGKTAYALSLCRKLSAKTEVLYVNMEIYGGIGGHFPDTGIPGLTDLLYYVRQESKNFSLLLSTIVRQMEGYDYIAPVKVSEDIKTVDKDEWAGLIQNILENSVYETVILDLDEGLQGIYDILSFCTEVHMPVMDDALSQAKVRQFEQELEALGYENIHQKIIKKEQHL